MIILFSIKIVILFINVIKNLYRVTLNKINIVNFTPRKSWKMYFFLQLFKKLKKQKQIHESIQTQ